MMNYENKPHIVTTMLLYFAIFIIFIIDAIWIFLTLILVNFFYSLFHNSVNINFDDILIMNLISSLIMSLFLLFKKRKAIGESASDFIDGMNKIL